MLRARSASSLAGAAALGLLAALPLAVGASSSGDELASYRRPTEIPFPADNARTPERVSLGEKLFFEPRLSASGLISCGTCHNPALDWSDGLPRAVGHQMKVLARRTPSIANLAWGELYFWDGRAASLEEQALGPITSAEEMNLTPTELVARIQGIPAYRPLFDAAYPGEGITPETIAKALASFERSVVSGPSAFDRWVAGDDDAISASAKRGFALFEGEARCATCHSGWRFTDDSFHDIGVPGDDRGRAKILEGLPVLEHAFKTPGLRDIARRAPYMHDGSEATLDAVIELYALGGRARRPSLSSEITPLELDAQERRDLIAFLETLTSDEAPIALVRLPR
jgi:cytochrome c peroxidase